LTRNPEGHLQPYNFKRKLQAFE